MGLFIEIYSGKKRGSRIPVRDGVSFGRRKAQILLDDPKVSGTHAKIEHRPDGFYLVDLQSANGIKINDVRFEVLKLNPGSVFVLGKTEFRVFDEDEVTREIVIDDPANKHWRDVLKDVLFKISNLQKDRPVTVRAFQWPVKLQVIQGVQYGTSWTLAYGPRKFGANSFEFNLQEYDCPGNAFELSPEKQGVLFKTDYPDIVMVNGNKLKLHMLHEGDVIEVRNTRIQFALERL